METTSRPRSPHIRRFAGLLIDYNGVGIWSAEGIQKRYREYSADMGADPFQLVSNRTSQGKRVWNYPLMEQVIERIEIGDRAAIKIGIEFIQEDDFFVFGRILKSKTARALRRAPLSEEQQATIRERLVSMLLSGNVPHEWGEYKRLLRKVGLGPLWPKLEEEIDRKNRYVMRHYDYLNRFARE